MSEENRSDLDMQKRLQELAAQYEWPEPTKKKLEEIAKKLLEDYEYRVKFLKNPQNFVEAEAGIEVDDSLMIIVWGSVRKLSDQNGQPKRGKLQGITLD